MMIVQDLLHSFSNNRSFRWVIYVSGILCIVKLSLLFLLPIHPHAIEDWYIAQHVIAAKGYSLSLGATALKTPVYPMFLIPFAAMGDIGTIAASAMQHVLLFCGIIAFNRACELRFNNQFALFAGLCIALHPAYAYYPYVLETTSITVPLFMIWWYLSELQISVQRYSALLMILGFIIGLNQPILLPAIIAYQVLFAWPINTRRILEITLSAILVFAPWSIRNAMTFGQFIPLKSPMWMNVYEGMVPTLSTSDIAFIESSRIKYNDVQMEPLYKNIVIQHFNDSPSRFFDACIHRIQELWLIPDRYAHRIMEFPILISRIFPQIVLLLGISASLYILVRHRHQFAGQAGFLWVIIGTLTYVTLIYGLTQASNIRFKLDIEWLQIVLLFPIFKLFGKLRSNTGTSSH